MPAWVYDAWSDQANLFDHHLFCLSEALVPVFVLRDSSTEGSDALLYGPWLLIVYMQYATLRFYMSRLIRARRRRLCSLCGHLSSLFVAG